MNGHSSNKKRLGAWLGAALLNILAVLGVVCIVLVILSFVFNISIMMFKTGSMSPTIPAGSIAFVREIPAQEMGIGDVVTVDRGEKTLPVTHRVISIDDADHSSGRVTFELRGDANEVKDPEPYTADTVRKVIFSIPGVAPILQSWRNPFLLGGITIAASLLVVWAFWPRRGEDDESKDSSEAGGPGGDGPDTRARVESLRSEARVSAQPAARSPKHAIATPVVAALLLGGGGLFGGVGPGAAEDPSPDLAAASAHTSSPAEVRGDFLRMRAFGDEAQMRSLSPGASAHWSVDVWTDAPDPGTVVLEIGSGRLSEPLASSLLVDVRACASTGAEDDCPAGSRLLLSGVPLSELGSAAGDARELLKMSSDDAQRVEVTATLDSGADAKALAGLTSSVRLTAIGHGEEISLGPGDPGDPGDPGGPGETDDPVASAPDLPGELPWTGVQGWLWVLLVAFVLIVVGSVVVARTKKSRVS